MQRTSLVLGGDLGGTSTRILVADLTGRVVARGAAGGSNPVSNPETAAAALATALQTALRHVDPARIGAAVVGAAGGVTIARPDVAMQFEQAWASVGLAGMPEYIGDIEAAFASATTSPDGTALIAGTGAGASELRNHRIVRSADLDGWLLGDDGSGYWLGREAARATLRALEDGAPLGPLGEAVLGRLVGPHPPSTGWEDIQRLRDQLIKSANSRPPVKLAELARTVSDAYDAGDPAAIDIAERATELLTGTIGRIRPAGTTDPLVLAGSVAGESSPVGRLLRERLKDDPGQVLSARDGVGGATWLALRTLDPDLATAEAHAELTA
jgi:N-acetylglucosamine kinase-like BadF-type ATPase